MAVPLRHAGHGVMQDARQSIDRTIDRLIDEDNLNNYFLYVETIFIYFVIKKHIIDLEYDQP